jgi:hypothetical protein
MWQGGNGISSLVTWAYMSGASASKNPILCIAALTAPATVWKASASIGGVDVASRQRDRVRGSEMFRRS